MTDTSAPAPGFWGWWNRVPLYQKILGGAVLGVIVGLALGPRAAVLSIPGKVIMQLLGAMASPLVLLAVVQALMHAQLPRGSALRLSYLLILNTVVAIAIGLAVANVIRPGAGSSLAIPDEHKKVAGEKDLLAQLLDNIPRSMLGPLGDEGKVIAVIFLAIALGIALRRVKEQPLRNIADLVEIAFRTLLTILHWIIQLIPLAVFGLVASIIGTQGFSAFRSLGMFVAAVLIALALQATWYLVRIHFGSWVRPLDVLRGMRDALVMAFSTASSTATMPVTYACLRQKVGLRERSASLGALVGSNFNNDGTALYEAMSALFISQMLGRHLTLWQQMMVMLTSIVASVGAAGIPEAGIVTMQLVLRTVGLPIEYNAILLTVDWFLDRCRTTVNVLGDVNVSCLLDGKTREPAAKEPRAEELGELTSSE